MKIKDTCSIITGGSRGMGKAIVNSIISRGGNVVIGDILDEEGEQLVNSINNNKVKRAVYVNCDVSKLDNLNSLFNVATKEFNGAQILFNNVGLSELENAVNDIDKSIKMYETNLTSVFNGTLQAKQHFENQSKLDPRSLAAINPGKNIPVYSFTKNAIMSMTQIFSQLNWPNIRINCVAPSFTRTESLIEVFGGDESKFEKIGGLLDPNYVAEEMMKLVESELDNGIVRFIEVGKVYDASKITVK
ncbi:NAD(P)-binding protein [Conidiobolus coronatus NRRL 28638]|uniref:NAD(P)-binding protein n=1 Tax=Conidiobolus coronatus (strain ATCC 28846 / CBS 209.66 / NRRL 28638) TaxID=796925 RepID=A0A137P8T0_CONC2|nr:NAD(P)-binding protein [Conidiobolus coronatus NRRL 28638]|eukprot:KXN71382.1 NAD(P)-binding protein [Conidiobolus coronatus NRRL 28638]